LYNPFFLYSSVGLGKTHLLQALGHKALELEPSLNIKYLTSEKFFQHFVSAVQSNKTKEFKEFYRQVDLLLIDDIQFLSGKEATQETFFHLFNELHQINKQIVIASDRHPKSLMGMEDRLLSRFEWGISIDIQTPSLEDKTAVIKFKSLKMGLGLSDEQIQIIAQSQNINYRDIEGILNRIQAKQLITKSSIIEDWEIKKLAGNNPVSNIISLSYVDNMQEIVNKTVLDIFGVSWLEVTSNSRKKQISEARQILMYIYKNNLKMSFTTIGKIFGKDHSTVIHSCEKIENSESFEIKTKLEKVKKILEQAHT
jgi:chromosomal replication initiator protein